MDYQVIKLETNSVILSLKMKLSKFHLIFIFNKKELQSCQFFITTEVATTGVL